MGKVWVRDGAIAKLNGGVVVVQSVSTVHGTGDMVMVSGEDVPDLCLIEVTDDDG